MRRSSAPPSTAAPPRRSRPRQSRPTSPSRAQRHRGRQSRLGPRGPRTPPPGGGLVPFAPSGETRQQTSPATRLATGGPRGRVPSGVRRPPGCHRGLLGTGTRATCYYRAMVGGVSLPFTPREVLRAIRRGCLYDTVAHWFSNVCLSE